MTDVSTTCLCKSHLQSQVIVTFSPLKIQKPSPVTNNSPSPDSSHPDLFQPRYVTPGFKAFSYNDCCYSLRIDRLEEIAKSSQVSAF